jgi:hypothetical protein
MGQATTQLFVRPRDRLVPNEGVWFPSLEKRFSIASVPIRSRSIHAKLWPTCGRLAALIGGGCVANSDVCDLNLRYLKLANLTRFWF